MGEQTVDSAMAGVLNATTPLWTLLVALAAREERRPSRERLVGLALGFLGALLIFEPWGRGGGSFGGELACLGAAASYGLAYVYMARHLTPLGLSPFVLAYGQMIAATLLLVPLLLIAGRSAVNADAGVVAATAVLGFVGTGIAYVINYAIVTRDGATVASTVTYLLPAIAAALGALVLDEALTAAMIAGTVVVLDGVALTRRSASESAA